MEQKKLPYKEWYTIQEVANKLNCSIDDLIYWSRYYIDLYLNADSLYGQLSISCDKDAPAINAYTQYYKELMRNNQKIDKFSFSARDLARLLPNENNQNIYKMMHRYLRSTYNPFFVDLSTDDRFHAEIVYKGTGHWRVSTPLNRSVKLYSQNNEKFYKIGRLYLNRKYYSNFESRKEFINGLDVSFRLYDEILVSQNDFVIRVNDYEKLIKGDELEYQEPKNNFTIGKPSHFYKKFAIDTACLTRKKNPQSKVADIARKIYFTIIDNFNSVNPPTKDTISNWLYEIKLGKPTEKSSSDFELVIPDEWQEFSE